MSLICFQNLSRKPSEFDHTELVLDLVKMAQNEGQGEGQGEGQNAPQDAPQNAPRKLTKRQEKILQFIRKNPTLSKAKIGQGLNLSFDIVKRELEAMSDIVKHIGSSTKGHWEIIG